MYAHAPIGCCRWIHTRWGWLTQEFRTLPVDPKVRTAAAVRPRPSASGAGRQPSLSATGSNSCAIMQTMVLDPAIGTLVIASVAMLFASAGVHKLRDLARFEEIFSAYDLLPGIARLRISWVVPMLEFIVATGLIVKPFRLYAAALGILLLSAYAAAIGVNLMRGRRDLACGCGGPNDKRPIAAWMIWRNLLIALAAAIAFATWTERPLEFTDAFTIAFGLLTIVLVYLCVDQLFGNAARTATLGASR
jgi:hypothetical protein